MASLRAAEEAAQALNLRPRETANLARNLRHMLNEVIEHARALDFGLATLLAERAIDLAAAMERNPAAAARGNAGAGRAMGSVITAMKRVGQNRMAGDGAEAGLKLLEMIDSIIAPVRAAMI